MAAKGRIEVDQERCKGCGLCVTACPKQVIVLEEWVNQRGYHPAALHDPNGDCTGCALCAVACPDACITVYRLVPARKREKSGVGT